MAEFRFETDRLILRDWRAEDWAVFFRYTNTPGVMRWLGGLLDDAGMAGARGRVESYAAEHGHTFWAVERKADEGHLAGALLGFCGLKRSNQAGGPQGEFEIGWRLREDAWGHGYAREAALAVRDLAFERFAAPRIIALTVPENQASWGLMHRLGMTPRPELDFVSAEFGSDRIIVYALERAEWEGLRDAA